MGISHWGKFEKYFRIFANRLLPLIHTQYRVIELFQEKSDKEQVEFYHRKWNNLRWRLLFRIFFSRMVMGKLGRDPQFMNEVKIPVSQFIFKKAEAHLVSKEAQTNFMLRYQLTGNFGNLLPHYLEADNYKKIKNNAYRIVFRKGYIEENFKEYGKFNAMNLSDIFEYLPDGIYRNLASQIKENLHRGGRAAYWNLMVPRNLQNVFPEELTNEVIPDRKLDRGFFYKEFVVNRRK